MQLECKDLIKIYPSPTKGLNFPALRGLDLKVNRGELIAIIGPSGSGKTTLIRLISAYDSPSSGEIWFEERFVNKFTGLELTKYRTEIGIMYQSPSDNLVWGMSAINNVLFPMRFSGKFKNNLVIHAKELLAKVGLKNKEKRKPYQLSGGEQQRVSIAVALANRPKILLADEPTGELDTSTTMMIIDYFKELNRDLGLTILVMTHDKRFSQMTDRTYRIQDGRLTGIHFQVTGSEKIDQRDEVVIVDKHGNIRLPSDILKDFPGLTSLKVQKKGKKIELIPYESDCSNKEID